MEDKKLDEFISVLHKIDSRLDYLNAVVSELDSKILLVNKAVGGLTHMMEMVNYLERRIEELERQYIGSINEEFIEHNEKVQTHPLMRKFTEEQSSTTQAHAQEQPKTSPNEQKGTVMDRIFGKRP